MNSFAVQAVGNGGNDPCALADRFCFEFIIDQGVGGSSAGVVLPP
jgi:hypothetical protein